MTEPQSLYVMKASNGRVKIGRSKQVAARAVQLRSERNTRVSVVYSTEPIVDAKPAELIAVRLLRLTGTRVSGEWFSVGTDVAIAAVQRALRIHEGIEPPPDFSVLRAKTPLGPVLSMRLDPELKERLKELAARENRSLTNYIETQLREISRQVAQRNAEMEDAGTGGGAG